MEFEIRLSGSVEVRAAGRRNDLGSTKTRLALAALAWDAGRTVSVDTLIHRIWDENPPAKAREALHTHVSRIRKAFRIAGADAPPLTSRTNSYLLGIDPDRVDLRRYTSYVDQARSLAAGNCPDQAIQLLDDAAGLWRGEPLAGIAAYWAGHLRDTVTETRLTAAVVRAEILMAGGEFTEAVPVLLPLAQEHPDDEALVERLALALYGSRRVAEATKLLQRTRQRLVRDTGLDSGRRLHQVQRGILAGTPAPALLEHSGVGARAPARSGRHVPDNLPRDIPWVGRRDELRRLTAALTESPDTAAPVITIEAIDGLGGVGKTSMAVHLAHQMRDRFPDGRLYLHLRGYGSDREPLSATHALTELLRLLGTGVDELPQNLDGLVSLWRLTVRDRRMVVILDDAAGPEQVKPLLPGASPTAVVVTSRRRLAGLPGVRSVSLDVLPHDDAIALFDQWVDGRHVSRVSDVARIVQICGHLPLAIEIVANRLLARPSWTTSDLLTQLARDGGLAEIRDGERTLRDVFASSYDALSRSRRLVFRRVGHHFGYEFGPHAVAALTGLSLETTESALEELLAHRLISEPSPHRFTIHDLLRTYARTLPDEGIDSYSGSLPEAADDGEAGEVEDGGPRKAMRQLAAYYLRMADRADRLAYPFRSRIAADGMDLPPTPSPGIGDARSAERWLVMESANLLSFLDWTRQNGSERQLALCVHVLAGFLDMEGYLATADPPLRRAVAHWRTAGEEAARARALLDLSVVCVHGGKYDEGYSTAREALGLARSLKDTVLESECIHHMSIPMWHTGQLALAQNLQERALFLRKQLGDILQIARSHNFLGIIHLHLGQDRDSVEYFQLALTGFTDAGDDRGRYRTLNNVAELWQKLGNKENAERYYREALSVSKTMGGRGDRATLQMNLASVLTDRGNTDEALALYEMSLPALRAVGDVQGEGTALNGTGRAHRAAGRSERALPHHLAALAVMRRIQAAAEEIGVLYDLALAELDTGRLDQAATHLAESRAVSRRIGARADEERAALALERLGRLRSPES
ncbi:tetratricopeptide repeat protein [Streptomyces sp. NPDC057307]|uniref:AfsR/SARP family transcriptional regulator n=1 Tax=Streptomyces sp. NPDC057307 TaxID=3346096 RepID=UPI00363258D9